MTTPSKAFIQTVYQQIPDQFNQTNRRQKLIRKFPKDNKINVMYENYSYVSEVSQSYQIVKIPVKVLVTRLIPHEPIYPHDEIGIFYNFPNQFQEFKQFKQPGPKQYIKVLESLFKQIKSKLKIDIMNKEFGLQRKLACSSSRTIFRDIEEFKADKQIQSQIQRISKIQSMLNKEKVKQ